MGLDNPLAQGQSNPHAPYPARRSTIDLIKALEDILLILGRDTDALVNDGDVGLSSGRPHPYTHGGTRGAKFDRIVDQIIDHLFQQIRIERHI